MKRIIDGSFQINGTREDLKIIKDCLEKALSDSKFNCGWVSIYDEYAGSDRPPMGWTK
jgi:hypothetical protein